MRGRLIFSVLAVLLVLGLAGAFLPVDAAQAADISITIDGNVLSTDVAPVNEDGRVLVPMRSIFEALGANVDWDGSTSTVTATRGETNVKLTIDSRLGFINGEQKYLDVPARLVNNRTLVPIRFVSEALGATVDWVAASNQVVIATLPTDLSGSLKLSGSTSVQPVAEELAQAFMAKYPAVNISITGGGSGVGINDAAAGKVNIGNASRDLKPAEAAQGLIATVIARDAIAVVVNPANPVSNLTKEQVTEIFTGKITNWEQVGGNNAPIIVNSRTAPSGTLDYFVETFLGEEVVTPTAKQHASNGLLRQAVAANENAVGFLSMGYLDSSVKAPNLDGQEVNMDTARAGSYNIVRNFNMVTMGAPTGLAKAFIDWIRGPEGQAIVTKEYLPPK